jgi:hypothetical protein
MFVGKVPIFPHVSGFTLWLFSLANWKITSFKKVNEHVFDIFLRAMASSSLC